MASMEPGWEAALHGIPEQLQFGLVRYLKDGVTPGSFLTACIENNLLAAVSHADPRSLEALPTIVRVLYNYCPSACWGSRDKRLAWRGLEKAA